MAASLNGEDYPAALGLHHHNPGTPKRLLEASYRIDKFELGSEGELFRHSHCRVSLLVRVDPNDREPSGTCLTFLAALFFIRWLLLPQVSRLPRHRFVVAEAVLVPVCEYHVIVS